MNTRHSISARSLASAAGAARGFTLVELIVAVAAVALLTVGIGQIFSSVGRLVGAGNALAETDQFARALESQMRADFDSMSRLTKDEVFVVIRNRRLGDVNGNEALEGNESAIYLNSADKEADRREAVQPYAASSKAITVRLDDIAFVSSADGDSASAQRIPPNMVSPGEADHVRVYYGHGLRPPIDRRFNPIDPPARPNGSGNVPPRLYFADGDFGTAAGRPNFYFPSGAPGVFSAAQGRNEFAGDWLLLRQPMLLGGGLTAGYALNAPAGARPSEWMYSPFIRGLECVTRSFNGIGSGSPMNDWGNTSPIPASGNGPYARVLYHGRADVCAQRLAEAKRWLEGVNDAPPQLLEDASAFDGGLLDDAMAGSQWLPTNGFPSPLIDAPLWQRESAGAPGVIIAANHRSLISAIAGCMARFQAEDDPPTVERRDVLSVGGAGLAVDAPRPRFQQVMDMHAVIASRVSNFEIAWTDGKTWPYESSYDRLGDDDITDADRDGDFGLADNIERGDVIWYDMDFTRYTNPTGSVRDLPSADSDNLIVASNEVEPHNPEVCPGRRNNELVTGGGLAHRYDARATGAATNDPDGQSEYLAVFPFRKVSQDGGYESGAFEKPRRIRVRLTVHDAQFRLPGGRQYEFEFPIDLQ